MNEEAITQAAHTQDGIINLEYFASFLSLCIVKECVGTGPVNGATSIRALISSDFSLNFSATATNYQL